MAFSTQQLNTTDVLVSALERLKTAIYDCYEAKDAAALIGIPVSQDFPAQGALDHITRPRLQNAHGLVDKLKDWLTTAIVLEPGNAAKKPIDALVEVLRGGKLA